MEKIINVGGRLHNPVVGGALTGADEIKDDTRGKMQNVINQETDAELVRLDGAKQEKLTFDQTPTEGSTNPVTSGGVYAADVALQQAIEAILLLIPSAASALNQLADKSFVNSSIETATATFRGTYNLVTDLELTVSATHQQIAAALASVVSTADNNDYCFVQIPVSDQSTDIRVTERYKFDGTSWEYEYDLNNSGFTADQWAAINSGITSVLVGKLGGLPTAQELATMFAGKQNTLTFDSTPVAGSDNPVKSSGLYNAFAAINAIIPEGADANNKLVAESRLVAYVTTLINALDASFDVTSADGHVTLRMTQADGVITSVQILTFDIASASALTTLAGRVSTAESDIDALQDAYAALTQSDVVIVEGALPSSGQQQNIIYRQPDQDHTPPQFYSDYMWNGTTWVLMATYMNAIDQRPKKGSQNLVTSGGVFDNMGALDVSELNATENPHTLATYANLAAALAAIPSDYQKGGMSIKFVCSSDNKYVQFRYMGTSTAAADFTNIANWQGVDDEPTAGSDNLVKSGGVYEKIGNLSEESFSSSDTTNMVWDASSHKFLDSGGSWKSIYVALVPGGKYKVTGVNSSIVNLRTYNVEPALNVEAELQHTYTEGVEFTAQPNDLYLEINGTGSLGTNPITLNSSYGLIPKIVALEQDVNGLEQDVEQYVDALDSAFIDNTETFTSSDYDALIYDNGSEKFVSATNWKAFHVKLIPGNKYTITNTSGAARTFNVKPELGVSAQIQNEYQNGIEFIAQSNDLYLEIYGNTDGSFSGATLEMSSVIPDLLSRVEELEDTVGKEGTETFTSDDYDTIIYDNGSEKFVSATNWKAFHLKLVVGGTYKVTGTSVQVRTFNVKPELGVSAQIQHEYQNDIEFTAQSNDLYLEIYGNTDVGFSSATLEFTVGLYLKIEQLEAEVGKRDITIMGFGDSIMLMPWGGNQPTDYVAEETGYTVHDCGFGGTRWKPRNGITQSVPETNSDAWNALDLVNLIDIWINHPEYFDTILSLIRASDGDWLANLFSPGINKLKTLRPTEVDVYMFMMGGNDLTNSTPLGTTTDNDTSTICGCIKHVITALLTANPDAKIYLFGNIQKWIGGDTYPDEQYHSDNWTNSAGYKMQDLNAKIEEMADKYKLPFCPLYNTLGWNPLNWYRYYSIDGTVATVDGSHPFFGVQFLGRKMGSFIKSNVIY